MSAPRLIATAATLTALAATGVAGAAEAPVVSKQRSVAGAAPLTIPGTGIRKGERLPAGARLVYKDVTLERGQQARVTLRAPAGKRIRGLAVPERQQVGFAAQRRDYVGHRQAVVRAFVARTADDGEVTGRIYALTR